MQHIIDIVTNPLVLGILIVLFFGEYLPFTKSFWKYIGLKLKSFGNWFLTSYENRLYDLKESKVENRKVTIKLNNFFARALFFIISTLVVTTLEIVWELGFKGIRRTIEHTKVALWARKKIGLLPNWAVLVLFSLPFVLMELLGIFALAAFVSGQVWIGIIMYVLKVLLFIPVHFILHAGEKQLMAITWFKRRYEIISAAFEWFKKTQTYVKVHNITKMIKAYIDALKVIFFNMITLQKKVFKHEDILSPECEEIRQNIIELKKLGNNVDNMYVEFFNCIDAHIEKSKV
ncbi:MAG: hypothetical protein U9P71_03900 [Campylobacterota bacterium]|nr:hypothetical protein [Campylobacterota bacterium]